MARAHPDRAVEVDRVLVPLDGSERADVAVPVARVVAERLGVPLTLVTVVEPGEDEASSASHLRAVAAETGATWRLLDGRNVAACIRGAAGGLPDRVVCMASHGRGRSAALLGSVASVVAAGARGPLLVVGPNVSASHQLTGDVVACVDGSKSSERVLPVAADWATALGLGLEIVTVAEPVPQAVTPGAPYHRSHGPSLVAEDYLDQVAAPLRERGVAVGTTAIYDPVSVVGGLADHFEGRPPALIATMTHARTGFARLALGSVAASIVHELPAPVLLVPGAGDA